MEQYGETVVPPRTGKPGRPRKPLRQWPEGTAYATVKKTYAKGTVSAVERKLVHGSEGALARALADSASSDKVNTAFVERQNGTDRTYNARKVRKTLQFSKDLAVHAAVTWWVMFCYNFHHIHRGLLQRMADGTYRPRTPAMAAGLAERPRSVADILATQVVGFTASARVSPAAFGIRCTSGPAP
jgi:hypothetical protein